VKTRERNALSFLFGMLWRYSAGNHKRVVLYWALFISGNAIQLIAGPWVVGQIINSIQVEQGVSMATMPSLAILLAIGVLVELVFWLHHGPARILERLNAFKARASYRSFLLQGVLGLPLDWHTEHHSGDTIDKMEKGASALMSFGEDSFEIISPLVKLCGACIMLAYYAHEAIAIVLCMILCAIVITIVFDRRLMPQYRQLNWAENRIAESVFDAVSNITTVIVLRVEALIFQAIRRKIEEPLQLFNTNSIINEIKWFLISMCCAVNVALVIGYYCYQQIGSEHLLPIGNLYILIKYLGEISNLFYKFTGMYSRVVQLKAKVLNAEELSQSFIEGSLVNHTLPQQWSTITIKNLSFGYQGNEGEQLHLEDVTCQLHRGEKIALVGESGSGKTTLLKLIRDLYHPQSLELEVDGKVMREGFSGIARAIALIPQEAEIFATTIAHNITLGADYPDDLIQCVTDMACFSDVVTGLPMGLQSSIKEKGVSLSGGEKQRLALARGFLASMSKDMVLLDEPTSSLDALNGMRVYQNIFEVFKNKTVISSIHRLDLLPLFDRVFFFKEGRLVRAGTLQELLQHETSFASFYAKQFELAT
jgi:ABC-type multidrug transport system fused ATPase/permease subunit